MTQEMEETCVPCFKWYERAWWTNIVGFIEIPILIFFIVLHTIRYINNTSDSLSLIEMIILWAVPLLLPIWYIHWYKERRKHNLYLFKDEIKDEN